MNNNRLVITILVLIIALIGIGWFLSSNGLLPNFNKTADATTSITVAKPTDWQAIFLTNGQVYFGKLDSDNGQFFTLSDIYYIQVQQPAESTAAAKEQQAQQQISLVKLGNELHGPVDKMRINRDQIIFIEQMKADSKVVQAIDQYKKNGPAPVPSPSSVLTTPSPKK